MNKPPETQSLSLHAHIELHELTCIRQCRVRIETVSCTQRMLRLVALF